MLRDDRTDGGDRRPASRNVLGEPLEICSIKPMAGFYRDGCCDTGREDFGSHTVCAVLTSDFLEFSKSRGNDLSTPMPEFGFPGLKPGDRWARHRQLSAAGLIAHDRSRVIREDARERREIPRHVAHGARQFADRLLTFRYQYKLHKRRPPHRHMPRVRAPTIALPMLGPEGQYL
jgi:uncharacterized protein (DUF2237 family)